MGWNVTWAGLVQPYTENQLGSYTASNNIIAIAATDYDWRHSETFGFVYVDFGADIYGGSNPLVVGSYPMYFATQRFELPVVAELGRIFFRTSKYIKEPFNVNLLQYTNE